VTALLEYLNGLCPMTGMMGARAPSGSTTIVHGHNITIAQNFEKLCTFIPYFTSSITNFMDHGSDGMLNVVEAFAWVNIK